MIAKQNLQRTPIEQTLHENWDRHPSGSCYVFVDDTKSTGKKQVGTTGFMRDQRATSQLIKFLWTVKSQNLRVSEWKTQLAIFATVTTETAANKLLDAAGALTAQSVKQNQDLFSTLVDITVGRSAKGAYNLRDIIAAQGAMATKLESVSASVDTQYQHLEEDKKALEASSQAFRGRIVNAYNKNGGGFMTAAAPAPKPTGR